jgi:hypothetical protein
MSTYRLQNRYQDEGWSDLPGEIFAHWIAADDRARQLSRDAICYGMVRVVDADGPVVYYPAGGGTPRFYEGRVGHYRGSSAPPRPTGCGNCEHCLNLPEHGGPLPCLHHGPWHGDDCELCRRDRARRTWDDAHAAVIRDLEALAADLERQARAVIEDVGPEKGPSLAARLRRAWAAWKGEL